jgi:hypothetical protein
MTLAGIVDRYCQAWSETDPARREHKHHGIARFGFEVIGADGNVLRAGTDVVFMSADGTRIERIIGFFGSLARDPQ